MASCGNEEILDLVRHLKRERLFISAEKLQLQQLNESVHKTAETLYHIAWISREQRVNLESLLRNSLNTTQESGFHKANALECVKFFDAYKLLSYHENKYSEMCRSLRNSPKLIASCLVFAEKQNVSVMQNLAGIIHSAIYGSCVLQEDERYVLQILRILIENQLAVSDDPARLLRRESCAFCIIYKQLIESSSSARLFLTAALNKPVMFLLKDFEWFYDVDPEKALQRFSSSEQLRRFGIKGSDSYNVKTKEYRMFIVNKLVQLTECFITSIKKNMYCFPQSLAWIVAQLNYILTNEKKVPANTARGLCIDLIFVKFICPAICDPAAVGITSDVPISYIARHNLMQVATILQLLAISRPEENDPKTKDLYSKFDCQSVSSLFDPMLENASSVMPPQPYTLLQGIYRSAVFITASELHNLVLILRRIQSSLPEENVHRKLLDRLLNNLPTNIRNTSTPSSTPSGTPPGTPSAPLKKHKGKKKSTTVTLEDVVIDETSDVDLVQPEDVLVMTIEQPTDCIGLMSEDKVVQQEQEVQSQRKIKQNFYPGFDEGEDVNEDEVQEKRTRFSLSQDQDSLGNTSDNVEAISEACSSHSVESADSDINEENDNMSDMYSANVSGRETPNISGRDTPTSQVDGNEEVLAEPEPRQVPDLPITIQKTNRIDVTERFQKFDIKAEMARERLFLPDEMKSTVSDTWSTDVLASDSEPPDSNQLDRLEEVAEEMLARGSLLEVQGGPISEVSETASECWSTDVLASDTDEKQSDRLLELDQDDSISVSSKSQGIEDNMSEYSEAGAPDMQTLDDMVGPVSTPADPPSTRTNRLKLSPRPPLRPDNFDIEFRGNSDNFDDFRNEAAANRFGSDEVFDSDSSIIDRGERAKFRRSSIDHSRECRRLVIPDLEPPPDHGVASMDNTPDATLTCGTSSLVMDDRERDSGISETPLEENISSSFKSLKLTEQQNTTIDANRLSAAISMFDPIMQESDDDLNSDFRVEPSASKPVNSSIVLVELDLDDEKEKSVNFITDINSDIKERSSTGGSTSSLELPKAMNRNKDEKGDRNKKSYSLFQQIKEKINKGAKRKSKLDKGELPDDRVAELLVQINGAAGDVRYLESTDDILAKYSKKMSTDPRFTDHLDKDRPVRCDDDEEGDDYLPAYDPNNIENCRAFLNAKKKLRMVFSTADFQTLPWSTSRRNSFTGAVGGVDENRDNDVVSLLRMQQAEAISLQDKELVAQLHETIRCVRMFDQDGVKKLLRSLKEDYKLRTHYISYLVKCRQSLLASQAHLERLIDRVQRDKDICHKHFISTCVHRFLQIREKAVILFMDEFQKLTVSDEKTDLVEKFLENLYVQLSGDIGWQTANETQIEDGELAIERMIMNRIYAIAMFPNGDGDITRDKILHEHFKKLSTRITPTNAYLRIPKVYHSEAPWVSAQEEIKLINAYKTPKDKVQCVLSTSSTIMNLLSMASEKSVPAADDFIPVMIFVLLKANPPHLLSNVQYVDSFYQKRIAGEEQYWWMQFCSAIEFIKTMEYNI